MTSPIVTHLIAEGQRQNDPVVLARTGARYRALHRPTRRPR
jgi:hypothetical protein